MHTFPVPGGPASTMTRPAIFLEFIVCSTIPIACKHKEHDHNVSISKPFLDQYPLGCLELGGF